MSSADRAHARALLIIALIVAGIIVLFTTGAVALVVGIVAAVGLQ